MVTVVPLSFVGMVLVGVWLKNNQMAAAIWGLNPTNEISKRAVEDQKYIASFLISSIHLNGECEKKNRE